MSDDRGDAAGTVGPGRCAFAALRSGLWLDGVLLLGILVVASVGQARWTEVYTIILATGLVKSVSTGLAAYFTCRKAARRMA